MPVTFTQVSACAHPNYTGEIQSFGGHDMRCPGSVARRFQSVHKRASVDVEAVGDLQDVVQCDVAPPTFNLTEVGPVQPAALGGLLLTESQLGSSGQHPTAELTRRRRDGRLGGGGHTINPIGPMTINPETLNPMFMNPGILGEPRPGRSGSATTTAGR